MWYFSYFSQKISFDISVILSEMSNLIFCEKHKKMFQIKNMPFKYIENFTTKNWKFSDKNSNIFYISIQIIDLRTL